MLTQIYLQDGRTLEQQLEIDRKQGFNRLEVNGEMVRIDEYAAGKEDVVYLLVDRMTAAKSKDAISRLTDSAETAMYEGDGMCMLRFYQPDGTTRLHTFSTKFEADGMTFEEPNDQMFSFNSPIGACPVCEGFGKVIGIDEHLVVPNRSLSVYDGAIVCWRGEKMGEWREELIHNAEKFNFPIFTPYYELTDEQRRVLWEGNQYFHGINDFFKMLEENQYKIQYRVMLARYRGKTLCPKCHGTRLKPEAGYVRVGGKNISELVDLPITELQKFFDSLTLNEHDQAVARRIPTVESDTRFVEDVKAAHQAASQRSGQVDALAFSARQRISEAVQCEIAQTHINQEPDAAVDFRQDTTGYGLVVFVQRERVEEFLQFGDMKDLKKGSNSYTVKYLLGEETIPVPEHRRML